MSTTSIEVGSTDAGGSGKLGDAIAVAPDAVGCAGYGTTCYRGCGASSMAFGATLLSFTIRDVFAVPQMDARLSRAAGVGLPDMAELAADHLDTDILRSAGVLDRVAACLAGSGARSVSGGHAGRDLVEA